MAGFLGSRLADWILVNQPDYQVVGIDDFSGGFIENIDERVIFYRLDCASLEVRGVFAQHSPKYVFHFAAYAAEGLSPFVRKFNYQSNLIATANIINECIRLQVDRLIFTSSMAVYGHGSVPFNESNQPEPIDPYGIAKYACEMDIKVAGDQHELDWCIIRPHNLYGVKQNIWDTYRNVLGIWMRQHLNKKPMTIFGDGSQKRAFSFVDDCLVPIWKAATSEVASKQIINLGSAIEYSVKEAAETLIEIIGSGELTYLEQRHEVKNAYPTGQKSMRLLDFEDKTDLRSGLTTMWDWAKSQTFRELNAGPEYELDKGIYDFWKIKNS